MRHWWLFGILALGLLPLAHADNGDDLLQADQAFRFSAAAVDAHTVAVDWNVADGYYLYQDRIKLSTDTPGVHLGKPDFPPPEIKQDEFFGKMAVYHHRVSIRVPVMRDPGAPATIHLIAVSQGCADGRVCYPPHTQTADLTLPAAAPAAPAATPAADPLAGLKSLGRSLGLGSGGGDEPLDPDVAYQFSASVGGPDTLVAHWKIADGYYLYKSKFKFTLQDAGGATLGTPQLPTAEIKNDPFFGREAIYHHEVEARLPVVRPGSGPATVKLVVGYQGCAEAGICYPPMTKTVSLTLPAAAAGSGAAPTPAQAASTAAATVASAETPAPPPVSEQDRLAQLLTTSPLWLSMAIFFGLGIGLAFTPCIFPMVPILSSIIVGQGERLTTARAFVLSLAYVLAMAVTYTLAGVIAAKAGENLQATFQNPWILGGFAALFVLLSLSMFGFYELQVPASLQSRLSNLSNRQQGGSIAGVAVMGFLSALIVGPCVAAPLAGALLVIGQTGDAVLGGAALFALSLGMGAPLLAIGTGAGKLLPRAGDWMNTIKGVFGVLLLAVAIWMLERVLPEVVTMVLWAALLIVSSIYLGALDSLPPDATGWRRFWKGAGLVMLIYGAMLLVGAAAGGRDPFQPLQIAALGPQAGATAAAPTGRLDFTRVKTVAQLEQAVQGAAREGRPAMLDFYADWCVSCKEMEKYTFSDPTVHQALANAVLLQVDVTRYDADDKALIRHFGLIGPPAILFFGADGQEHRAMRVVGFMKAGPFAAHVRQALGG